MPLSHLINKKVFVTHGGLFAKDGVKIEDIKKTNRVKELVTRESCASACGLTLVT